MAKSILGGILAWLARLLPETEHGYYLRGVWVNPPPKEGPPDFPPSGEA